MINPKYIREDMALVRRMLTIRNMEQAVDLGRLEALDAERRALVTRSDQLREQRNKLSKEIGARKAKKENADDLMREVDGIAADIKDVNAKVEALEGEYNDLVLSVPNILDGSVPEGGGEEDNVVVRTWGEKPVFDFTPKPHFEIGVDMNILDFERGVKIAGTRFYVYRDLAARLERAMSPAIVFVLLAS